MKRLPAKKFFEKFFYIRVEKGAIFWYIMDNMEDSMDMEPLLKSYIRYALGFVPKERMAYATNNGEYDSIKILVDSKGNILVADTYAITFELYKGKQRIIMGSLWLSGRNLYIIEPVVNAVLYKRHIREMMDFEEFCDANNNIPRGILKVPMRLV